MKKVLAQNVVSNSNKSYINQTQYLILYTIEVNIRRFIDFSVLYWAIVSGWDVFEQHYEFC